MVCTNFLLQLLGSFKKRKEKVTQKAGGIVKIRKRVSAAQKYPGMRSTFLLSGIVCFLCPAIQ